MYNEELHNLSSSTDSIRVVKSLKISGMGMWNVMLRRRKRPYGRCTNTYVVSIKHDLEEEEPEFVDWFELACDRVQ